MYYLKRFSGLSGTLRLGTDRQGRPPAAKAKYSLESSFWIREAPEMIVITSAAATLRSDLLHLSPSKIQNTPVVIFSVVEDYEFVKAFLKTPLIQGYFNGYLMQEKAC